MRERGQNRDMKQKVVIFSDRFNGPKFCESAERLGYSAYLFLQKEPKEDIGYKYYIVDPNDSLDVLAESIRQQIGSAPDVVICCIEQFCINIAKYAESIGVAVNSSNVYENLRDKKKMKKIWLEKEVTTAKAIFCEKISEVPFEALNYPVIIKPTLGAASAGVRICEDKESLKKQCQQILRFNLTILKNENKKSGFLIEEYITGEEYSVDTIWYNGIPYMDAIMDKGNPQGPNFPDRLYLTNQALSLEIREELLRVSHKAVLASGVKNGGTHTEIRLKDGVGYVIESALRPGAGGCFYGLFNEALGVSFYDAYILVNTIKLSDIQEKILENMKQNVSAIPMKRKYWYNIGYKGSGLIKNICGVEEILKLEHVDLCKIHKAPGEYLIAECDSFTYFGFIMGSLASDSFNDDYELLQETENMLSIAF